MTDTTLTDTAYCLRCEKPIYLDGSGVWRREATDSSHCPRNPANDGHEPTPNAALTDAERTILAAAIGCQFHESHYGECASCSADAERIWDDGAERIVAARVADRDTSWRERIEARDREWQRHLDTLPNEMADAWGGDAAWLTTGSKVATLVGDWLGDLHYDLTPLATEARTQGGA